MSRPYWVVKLAGFEHSGGIGVYLCEYPTGDAICAGVGVRDRTTKQSKAKRYADRHDAYAELYSGFNKLYEFRVVRIYPKVAT